MAETYLDNPAGRLYRILVAMQAIRPNLSVGQAMPEILGISPPLVPDLARAMGDLLQLPSEAQREIEKLTGTQSKERLLRWQPKVIEALNCLLFQTVSPPLQIGQIAALYGPGDLMALEFCSEALHLAGDKQVVDHDFLTGIRQQISDLLDVLESDSDLQAELRDLLIWNVRAMLRACDNYDLRGVAGISDAYNQAIGTMVNNWRVVKSSHGSSPATWKKVVAVLASVAALLGSSAEVITALEHPSASPAGVERVVPVVLPSGPSAASVPAARGESSANPAASESSDANAADR